MKSSLVVVFGVLSLALKLIVANKGRGETSRVYPYQASTGGPKPRFISFNSEEGKIDIDWDMTIPFISIPLKHGPGENGEVQPLLNINTKALGIAGLVTTILTLVVPLFTKSKPGINYHRSGDSGQRAETGNVINDIIFDNAYITPCVERMICSIVSIATHSENPTSIDKIIDGFSSHKWFMDVTNGSMIQDAVRIGREGNNDCSRIYKDCIVTSRMLKSLMGQFGIL